LAYTLDIATVQGDVAQTLANLTALRAEILANPKPDYDVHGHHFNWVGMYKFLSDEITACMKQLSQLQPFEEVGIAR
jgi:hypothetical protein